MRTICTYVAATVPVEKQGDVNPLLELAQKIGLDPTEEEKQEAENKEKGIVDPPVGSFERFMGSFGDPRRWAGHN